MCGGGVGRGNWFGSERINEWANMVYIPKQLSATLAPRSVKCEHYNLFLVTGAMNVKMT